MRDTDPQGCIGGMGRIMIVYRSLTEIILLNYLRQRRTIMPLWAMCGAALNYIKLIYTVYSACRKPTEERNFNKLIFFIKIQKPS